MNPGLSQCWTLPFSTLQPSHYVLVSIRKKSFLAVNNPKYYFPSEEWQAYFSRTSVCKICGKNPFILWKSWMYEGKFIINDRKMKMQLGRRCSQNFISKWLFILWLNQLQRENGFEITSILNMHRCFPCHYSLNDTV